jgi:CheY-like chemotaxis protein
MHTQPSVLYVEDNPQNRKLMQLLLQGRLRLPHVNIFEDSHEFATRLTMLQPQPDVIFLDIHVQPYDGFEMLQMIRQRTRFNDTPVVALTASVMNEEVQKLRQAGFNGCLAKPIDMNTFPDTLNRILLGESIWRVLE